MTRSSGGDGHRSSPPPSRGEQPDWSPVDPKTDGYLREFDDDLHGALNLVIHDLQTGGLSASDASRLVWQLAEWRVDFAGAEPAGVTALEVAEDAQVRVIEGYTDHNWPACPRHPNHPLWLAGEYLDRAWTCTKSGERIANLGGLAGTCDQSNSIGQLMRGALANRVSVVSRAVAPVISARAT